MEYDLSISDTAGGSFKKHADGFIQNTKSLKKEETEKKIRFFSTGIKSSWLVKNSEKHKKGITPDNDH